jgi:hypothetical protein
MVRVKNSLGSRMAYEIGGSGTIVPKWSRLA